MFEKSIEEIVGKLNAHRPGPLHSSGMTVALHDFLIDLTNVISFSPARMRGDIYLDIYGHKASADKWDAKAYASVVLSDRHTHCFIESTKTLQGKSIALPDCIHHTVSALANLEPFSTQDKFDQTSTRLINLMLTLDFIKDRDFEMSTVQRKAFRLAVDKMTASIAQVFPGYHDFAETSYRALGCFELDPFSKRMTSDKLRALREDAPNKTLTALYELNIGHIYRDIFGPKLHALSHTQRTMIDGLVKAGGSATEAELVQLCGANSPPQKSEVMQALAELIATGACRAEGENYKIRGAEFVDWYSSVTMPRRSALPRPLVSPARDVA